MVQAALNIMCDLVKPLFSPEYSGTMLPSDVQRRRVQVELLDTSFLAVWSKPRDTEVDIDFWNLALLLWLSAYTAAFDVGSRSPCDHGCVTG